MSRRFLPYLCVVLLLIAQQGALVHAAWHAGGGDAHAHEVHEGHAHDLHDPHDNHNGASESPTGQASLCAFDLAFGQMLGGAHGSCVLPVIAELPAAIASYTLNPRLGSEAVPAHSRGPPVSL